MLISEAQAGRLDLRRFWLRRWLRTLPNYYLFLILNLLLVRWLEGAWPGVWDYAVFAQNLAWPTQAFYQESWSLAVEEIFYLAAPLLIVIGQGRIGRALRNAGCSPTGLIILAIAVFTLVRLLYVLQVGPSWDEGVRKVVVARLDAIAYGVVAILMVRRFKPGSRAVVAVAAGGVAGLMICAWMYLNLPRDSSLMARTLLFNLMPASFAAMLPMAARWQGHRLPSGIRTTITRLALWSYALYVSHALLLRILVGALGWHGRSTAECLLQAVLFCALAILLCAAVYQCFERPWLALRDRIAPRIRPGNQASSAVQSMTP